MGVKLTVSGDDQPRAERFADRARERGVIITQGASAFADDGDTITVHTGQCPPSRPTRVWIRQAEGSDACACVTEGHCLQEQYPVDFVATQHLPVAGAVGTLHTVHGPLGVSHSFQREEDIDAYLLERLLPEWG